jgi:septum formation protein
MTGPLLLVRTSPLPPVILASQSSRRVDLLREILPGFRVSPSYSTELLDATLGARRLCEVNAQRKAFSVGERFPDHLVLGADTLVFLGDEPLSKPANLEAARFMLGQLAGRVHQVITGVCLVHVEAARMQMFSEVTYVRFRKLSSLDITDYLERVDVLDKAGAYALQDEGHRLIEAVEGSRSNVIGLPVLAVRAALEDW